MTIPIMEGTDCLGDYFLGLETLLLKRANRTETVGNQRSKDLQASRG
jgi:hypothetical protein